MTVIQSTCWGLKILLCLLALSNDCPPHQLKIKFFWKSRSLRFWWHSWHSLSHKPIGQTVRYSRVLPMRDCAFNFEESRLKCIDLMNMQLESYWVTCSKYDAISRKVENFSSIFYKFSPGVSCSYSCSGVGLKFETIWVWKRGEGR